jgi:hypothetical protein
MSWKLTREVRAARMADLLPDLGEREFALLILMADTCREEQTRMVSISFSEMEKLTGRDRTTVWRAVKGLMDKECIARVVHGVPAKRRNTKCCC